MPEMLRQRSSTCNMYGEFYLLMLLLSMTTRAISNVSNVHQFMTAASATTVTLYETTPHHRRQTSTIAITSNSLVQSANINKFTCDTSYEALIAMNAPSIQFVTNWSIENNTNNTETNNTTNTEPEPEPEDTTRRGIFSKIWSFLCNIFRRLAFKSIASSSTIASMSNNNDAINRTLFFGTEQATSINQNPIVAVFNTDSQQLIWCYDTYEIAGADGRAIGALHAQVTAPGTDNSNTANNTSGEVLYVIFTIDGTQGTSAEDFRRFTTNGWIPSYGTGGGPKVSVVTQINITTGAPITGTFLRSQLLSNGKTNSLVVTKMSYERNCNITTTSGSTNDVENASLFQLRIQAEAYYLPMSRDGRTPLSESDCLPDTSSPFNYTVTLPPTLNAAYTADCRTIDTTLPPTITC